MSCLPELTWTTYADGELDAEEARRADAHLVHCESCRARVLAVREESLLLARIFQERAPARPTAPARPRTTPRPLLSRPPALLALALLLGAVGTVVEDRLIAEGTLLGSFDPRTLVTRLFGAVFMLRDRAPGLFELALAVAATAGASGLATFALTGLLRRWMGPALLLVAVGVGVPQGAAAFRDSGDDEVRVGPGERIEGSLQAWAERVEIEGVVAGDLVAGAHVVTVRGVVEGNLFAFADELEIRGRVKGSVFGGVERVRVEGQVDGSLYAATSNLVLGPEAAVERGLALFAEEVELEGRVGRSVYGLVDRFALAGTVGQDVELRSGRVALRPDARVGGDLIAFLPRGREVEAAGALASQVGGELRVEPQRHGRDAGLARFLDGRFWVWLAVRITAAFLVGMLLYAVAPALFRPGRLSPARCLGLGALALVGAPVLLGLLGVTLVGLPLAVFGAFAYLAALYAAGILVAARVGAALLEPETDSRRAFGLVLLVGLLVLAVGTSLPFFGPVVRLLAVLGGLGILAQLTRDRLGDRLESRSP